MTLRVHVHGASGRMGRASVEAIDGAADLSLVGTTGRGDDLDAALRASSPDVLVEFTVAEAAEPSIACALEAGVHVVSGTTGVSRETTARLGKLAQARGVGLLLAPNFAIGVLLMQRFAREAARWLPDVEIIELHHDRKVDAPSGTALDTARQIAAAAGDDQHASRSTGDPSRGQLCDGVPVHSIRLPGLLAHQEVIFGGLGQALTIRHDTLDRRAFMPGVLLGVRRIPERTGLFESLDPFLHEAST